jgi:hypothetical protein
MNKLAWFNVALAIVGVAAAAGVGGAACTVTSGTGDDGGITNVGPDASTDSGTRGNDSGSGDAGNDTGTTQDGGLACSTPPQTGSMACDTCVTMSCDGQWCACYGDTSTVSTDAGMIPACLDYVNCVGDCVAGKPDAGVPPGTLQDCETACSGGDAGGIYPQGSVQNGNALLGCVLNTCGAQCQ